MLDGLQRIVVNTCRINPTRLVRLRQTKLYRITVTQRVDDGGLKYRQHLDIYISDTVTPTILRPCVEVIHIRSSDVISVLPLVRNLVVTDDDGVFLNLVVLVDVQGQAVDTVATVDILRLELVLSGSNQVAD